MMFENMSSEDKYKVGLLIGEEIAHLFDIVAQIDGLTRQEVVDSWVESYIADKIIEATEDDNASK